MSNSSESVFRASFTSAEASSKFNVPTNIFINDLSQKDDVGFRFIAVASLTFDTLDRILLIQRAANDSMPNLWEVPGGGCDDEDPSILYGVARELWEETGLLATHIGPHVDDGYVFQTRSGNVVCKYHFLADVETGDGIDKDQHGWIKVKLDPKEHQSYVWATSEEVDVGQAGEVPLNFTTTKQKEVIQQAFTLRKKARVEPTA